MKKLLLSAFLGVAALAIWAPSSHAWTFGLIPYHCGLCHPCGGCCGKCCGAICIRPYNAFSPAACGSVTLDFCGSSCGNGCANGACPGGVSGYLPGGDGCAPSDAAPANPAPANPAPHTQAAPYGGPIPTPYSYAPMFPPTVTPAVAPAYWTSGYGR